MKAEARPAPDFIGIGAQKAGTSWLHERLNELSEFSLTPKKELHYFDRSRKYPSPNTLEEEYFLKRLQKTRLNSSSLKRVALQTRGTLVPALKGDWPTFKWWLKWYFSSYNDQWYLSLFNGLRGIKGEITPSYAVLDEAEVAHMHRLLPDVKIIFLMRNPVERAWSHYRYSQFKYGSMDIGQVDVKHVMQFVDSRDQVLKSDYLRTIDTYLSYFNKGQIMLGFYDAIREQPDKLLEDIVCFLGGDPTKISTDCQLKASSNSSPGAKMPAAVEAHLNEKYRKMIAELAERYESYCRRWYDELNQKDGSAGTPTNKKQLAPTVISEFRSSALTP